MGGVTETANVFLPFIVCRPRKINFRFPFFSVCSTQTEVCSFGFPLVLFAIYIYGTLYIFIYYTYIHIHMHILYVYSCFKRKTEAQVFFLNPFNICSSYKQKLVRSRLSAVEVDGCQIRRPLRGLQ